MVGCDSVLLYLKKKQAKILFQNRDLWIYDIPSQKETSWEKMAKQLELATRLIGGRFLWYREAQGTLFMHMTLGGMQQ